MLLIYRKKSLCKSLAGSSRIKSLFSIGLANQHGIGQLGPRIISASPIARDGFENTI